MYSFKQLVLRTSARKTYYDYQRNELAQKSGENAYKMFQATSKRKLHTDEHPENAAALYLAAGNIFDRQNSEAKSATSLLSHRHIYVHSKLID